LVTGSLVVLRFALTIGIIAWLASEARNES
jgi:hypothetical protein